MPRLTWGSPGTRAFETGVDRGVIYVGNQPGIPWVGLTSVDESPDGGGTKSYYFDGVKYAHTTASEEFSATITAYTYPEIFAHCDGTAQLRTGLFLTQQKRKTFGLSYRTRVGNDQDPERGYKIHIVYNALAEPSQRNYSSVGETAEPVEFSWTVTTRPPVIPGYKPTAHVVIDSRSTDADVLKAVEDALYGDDENTARLPTLDDILAMYDAFYHFEVTDLGDGVYTISGPDEAITLLENNMIQFDWHTVVQVDEETYTISSG